MYDDHKKLLLAALHANSSLVIRKQPPFRCSHSPSCMGNLADQYCVPYQHTVVLRPRYLWLQHAFVPKPRQVVEAAHLLLPRLVAWARLAIVSGFAYAGFSRLMPSLEV